VIALFRSEWQQLIRHRRVSLLLPGTVIVVWFVGLLLFQLSGAIGADQTGLTPLFNAQIGHLFATGFCLTLQGWLTVVTPLLAISFFPVFDPSPSLSPAHFLTRLLALWALMVLCIIVTLPFFSILPLFGSMRLAEISWALSVVVTTTWLISTLALAGITLIQQRPAGLFVTYIVILGWFLASFLITKTSTSLTIATIIVAASNPFAALIATLAPAFPPAGPIASDLNTLLQWTHGVVERDVPLYLLYITGSGLAILLFIGIVGFVSRPKPRRWQHFDTWWSVVLVVYLTIAYAMREWWLPVLATTGR